MGNEHINIDKRPKEDLLTDADINNNSSNDFFSDFNATLVDDLDKSIEKKDIEIQNQLIEKEQSKANIAKILKIIAIVAASVLVLIICVVVLIKLNKQGNYVLNLIDSGVIVEQQAVFEDTSNKFDVDISSESTKTELETLGYNIVTLEEGKVLNTGETLLLDVVVNTKESWEETFSDHNTNLFLTYKQNVVGYDKVISYVNEYNNTNTTNKIVLPSKEDYESANTDLVMIEFEVTYPENFPTYNSDGKVFAIPVINTEIKGNCIELLADETDLDKSLDSYIVVDNFIYELSPIISLNTELKEVNKNQTVTYRFITSLPYNTIKDLYSLSVDVELNEVTTTYNIGNFNTTFVEPKEELDDASIETEPSELEDETVE